MRPKILIKNAAVVTCNEVIENGCVFLEDGRIKDIDTKRPACMDGVQVMDAKGAYLLPGFVDLHCDALESEIQPRPNSFFPVEMAFRHLERRLATQGITTMYHCVAFNDFKDEPFSLRSNEFAWSVVQKIKHLTKQRSLIRNKIHLRYEISNIDGLTLVEKIIEEGLADLVSFMDHTPGQGQYRNIEEYARQLALRRGYKMEVCKKAILEKQNRKNRVNYESLRALAKKVVGKGLALASHDDDTVDKCNLGREMGASISEFPVSMEIARKAKEAGMYVCVGAPNVVRGSSHNHNLSALAGVLEKSADILCSDYHPPSILEAVFKIARLTGDLLAAVRMATRNPAQAVNVHHQLGDIDVGKRADLILVEKREAPVVLLTIVDGKPVCSINYRFQVEEAF